MAPNINRHLPNHQKDTPLHCCRYQNRPSSSLVVELIRVTSLLAALLPAAEVHDNDQCKDSDKCHSVLAHLHHKHYNIQHKQYWYNINLSKILAASHHRSIENKRKVSEKSH